MFTTRHLAFLGAALLAGTLLASPAHADAARTMGDFNFDGVVGLDDFNILAGRFGTVLAAPTTSSSSSPFGGTRIGDGDRADDSLDDMLA